MFRSYLKITLRNFRKYRTFSLINILGLAIGLAIFLVIYQYIEDEQSYDRDHTFKNRTHRVLVSTYVNGELRGTSSNTPNALATTGSEDIPEIQEFVRTHRQYGGCVITNPETEEPYYEEDLLFVDSIFLETFNFPLRQGNPETALDAKNNIVISEDMVIKYFGKGVNPMGKTLQVDGGWAPGDFVVTGILEKGSSNTHMQFEFLIPMRILLENGQYQRGSGWGWYNFATYLVTNESVEVEIVEQKLDDLIDRYQGEQMAESNLTRLFTLQPVQDIHLFTDFSDDQSLTNGSYEVVRTFVIIAIFILIIAWVNYINLATARSLQRSKEVGVRKVFGAFKNQLVVQFMVQSWMINLIAAVLALLIAGLLLPVLNEIVGKELTFTLFNKPSFWLLYVGLILLGSSLSGIYPSLVLSAFEPASMLRSNYVHRGIGMNLRKTLVVFQFLVSILLITGTYIVYKQILFMKSQDPGMNMEEILVVKGPRVADEDIDWAAEIQLLKNEASSHSSVMTVSGSQSVPGKGYNWGTSMVRLGDPPDANERVAIVWVDYGFDETFDLELVAGQFFEESRPSDENSVVINEATVRQFGMGTPENALTEKLLVGDDTVNILGIVKDYHWNSLRDEVTPWLLALEENAGSYVNFKISMGNIPETLDHLNAAFDQFFPGNPFDYFFLDDEFNRQYQAEERFGYLLMIFSLIAVFIACLGLFALVSFSAEARIQEISIRKVLGASTRTLLLLLTRQYFILLVIANLIAIPAIIFGGNYFLDNFAYRISLTAELFFLPGLILLMIALFTVSYITITTARSNPAATLRAE